MYDPQRTRLARTIADEMAKQQTMTTVEEVDRKTYKVDIGGYTITTITVNRGIQVAHELHPKVAQRNEPADKVLLYHAEGAFTAAFLAVMKDEVNLEEV